ncbi:MAG TPA: hypothetical protein VFF98_09430 [Novosphingobium sp.]|nr:hypothetical protein [Novosphingobium sp.]HZV08169.1 hypothetical protein [Novosphingobium sp.]
MARYTLEACSRALAGREAEYAHWYRDVHLAEVVALPGFLSGRLHQRLDAQGAQAGELVAHYAVETDAPAALLEALFAAAPAMRLTDSIDMASLRFSFLAEAA